ncbi:MAG: hypothetical protein A3F54_02050 [Candidatus Kerfeldbacteria bacterium RIFCSPHIGHO2_12_FULL_48_17]|uniref:MIP18 family-like domain-containing protein n=1 Tax=Candidatus Kerfeldbacteria bacterium RIFCSPHIGHO2_12_FULL_48_17 TaxID=1798542 RepID=A0A1G2AZP6_9BACT|nr:MAG: hypothetical protein A3F54_02050 [Candidatus Kerfeldbacteria bacterium RIFCSPHIGHO2_12_FULL_48_17]
MTKITKKMVEEELKNVLDPELHVSIIDLGLVYGIDVGKDNVVTITMTLTTPACPLGPQLMQDIRAALEVIDEVKDVKIEFVWEPVWSVAMMSDEAKDQLNIEVD